MFTFFRTHQRLMQVVLLILVLPSFVLIGVSGYSSYTSNDTELVKIGSVSLTAEEFDQARRVQLQNLQQAQGGAFDLAVEDSPQARRKLLDALIDRTVLVETATKEGLNVSDGVLRQAIAAIPDFQVNGVFSPERYNTLLNGSGISIRDFEQSQRGGLTLERVTGPVVQTTELPSVVNNLLDKTLSTTRKVEVLNFATSDYLKPESVTEAEVSEWYEQNKESLRLPQYVDVDYVVLDEDAARQSVPAPTADDLAQYYEQNKSRFGRAERINLSHILVAVKTDASEEERKAAKERAEKLATEAKAGADFTALVQENSDDKGTARNGGSIGWISRGALPDMDAAIFELRTDDVSAPLQSADGYHVFKVNAYEAEDVQPLEAVAVQLEQEIRQQQAAQRFADMATQLTSLIYETPDSLQPTADALGLSLRQAKGVTRENLLEAAIIGEGAAAASTDAELLNDPRVRRALFSSQSLNQRQNAGVVEVASDRIVALRAQEVYPATVPALEQVKAAIVERLAIEKARQAVQEAGTDAVARLTMAGNETPSEFAFGWEKTISHMDDADLPEAVVKAALAQSLAGGTPEFVGVETDDGYTVVKITGESSSEVNPVLVQFMQEQMRQLAMVEMEQSMLDAMRHHMKVTLQPAVEEVLASSDEEEL